MDKILQISTDALGDPANPLSREGLIEKFMNQVEFSRMVTRSKAEEIVELIERLDEIDNVQKILELATRE
jgi:2-methylcitrate dehydratase PrpD